MFSFSDADERTFSMEYSKSGTTSWNIKAELTMIYHEYSAKMLGVGSFSSIFT